ncbi:hypothetical protein ACWDRR_00780 [Kitasatospora sp. NPDC003701]
MLCNAYAAARMIDAPMVPGPPVKLPDDPARLARARAATPAAPAAGETYKELLARLGLR